MNDADRFQAGRYIEALTGAPHTRVTFQTFDDSKNERPELARVLHGTVEERWAELVDLNSRGAGIFVTVNETDSRGRKKQNIVRVRGWWVDLDYFELPAFSLEPSILVKTKRGFHVVWLAAEQVSLDDCEGINRRLVELYQGDSNAVDASRVLRLPGFFHRKDPSQPFRILLLHAGRSRYTLAQMREAVGNPAPRDPVRAPIGSTPVADGAAWAAAALTREREAVARSTEPGRNAQLNRSAFSLGQLVGAGSLEANTVRWTLYEAAGTCGLIADDGEQQVQATLESGLGQGMIQPRATTASTASAQQGTASPFPTIRVASVTARQIEFLVEDLVPVNSCGFASGSPGALKTWLTEEITVAVASGASAFGRFRSRQSNVLMFNAEDDPATITRHRLERLALGHGLKLDDLPVSLINVPSLRIDQPEDIARLRITIQDTKASLVILDPLRNLHSQNEDSSTAMAPILHDLRLIQRATGCTILVVHHDRKFSRDDGGKRESRVRGTNSVEGWRDYAIYLDEKDGVVTVQPYVKSRPRLQKWTFQLEENGEGIRLLSLSSNVGLKKKVQLLLADNPEGMTRSEIRETLSEHKQGLSLAIDELLAERVLDETDRTITRKNGKPYTTKVVRLSRQGQPQ